MGEQKVGVRVLADRLYRECLYPSASIRGFSKRSKWACSRIVGDACQELSFSLQVRAGGKAGRLELGCSVIFPWIAEVLRELDVFGGVDAISVCSCGGSVLRLIPKDHVPSWYYLNEGDDFGSHCSDLIYLLENHIYGYLDSHSDLKQAVRGWKRMGGLYAMTRILLLWVGGHRDTALAELTDGVLEAEEDALGGGKLRAEDLLRWRRLHEVCNSNLLERSHIDWCERVRRELH